MKYISYDLEVSYKFMKLRKVIGAEVLMLFSDERLILELIKFEK